LNNRLLAAAVFAFALPLSAQSPYLVEDINPGFAPVPDSSYANLFHLDGDTLYFSAIGDAGRELWRYKSNGIPEMVKDINPGPAHTAPGTLIRVGDRLLFGAHDGDRGRELWQTDGTAAGTTLVKDINPTGASGAAMLFRLGSRALLFADDGVHGYEPWITDGTAAGTRLLADTVEGPESPKFFNMRVKVGDRVYLCAETGLWVTDGTTAGTIRLTSEPAIILGAVGSTLIFRGRDAEHGLELWRTDGTVAGTAFLTDIAPGTTSSYAVNPATAAGASNGSAILFFAYDGSTHDLWMTDGTAGGTHKAVLFSQLSSSVKPGRVPTALWYSAGLWWFSTREGLWRTDGTVAGTFLVSALRPSGVQPAFGRTLFTALDELWSTDGTREGTTLIKSFPVGIVSGPTVLDGKAYFCAYDGSTGFEPWVSEDGTADGTRLVANLRPEGAARSSSPTLLTPSGSGILFVATEDKFGKRIWQSDATSSGTTPIFTIDTRFNDAVANLTLWKETIFYSRNWTMFALNGGTLRALNEMPEVAPETIALPRGLLLRFVSHNPWFTDGTVAGTRSFVDAAGALLTLRSTVTENAGRWYFVASNGGGSALYTTEGTPETTLPVLSKFQPGPSTGTIHAALGAVYFNCGGLCRVAANDERGTLVKRNVAPRAWFSAGRFLYFLSHHELWRTDGTGAGTIKLLSGDTMRHTAVGDLLFFSSSAAGTGAELWRTDGTVAGTYMVADVNPGPAPSDPFGVAGAGIFWFSAEHASTGRELWRSDGTAAGTMMVGDLNPGPEGSQPFDFVNAGDRLFFAATTPDTGRELWVLPLASGVITVADVRLPEGNSGRKPASFTLTRSGSTAGTASVSYVTVPVNATAGPDYAARSGTVTFADGETTKTVEITVAGDTVVEGEDETFLLTLSAPVGATLARTVAVGIIEEDDIQSGPLLDARGSATSVTLTWSAHSAPGPVVYEIYRGAPATGFTLIGSSSGTQYSHPAEIADATHFYRVRARDANGVYSPFSNTAFASVRTFTDDPLIAQVTKIKASHFTELRSAINDARLLAGLPPVGLDIPPGAFVRLSEINALRAALNGVYIWLGQEAPSALRLSLTAGTAIKAAHIQELRDALR
jgi:ELWxxDGT repeat protein